MRAGDLCKVKGLARLSRVVAIRVVRDNPAKDCEVRERVEREAQVASGTSRLDTMCVPT